MRQSIVLWLAVVLLASAAGLHADPQPTLVAPRAVLVDPDDDDNILMSVGLHSKALQGSIAKLMSAYVVSWAVKKGYVSWSDKVKLTKRDTQQACSCIKFAATPPSPCATSSTTQIGEQFTLEDLVRVTLNQSTGESADAIAEHVARKVYGLPVAATVADSNHLMDLFIGLMNKRAKDLKLDDSLWITVHGGDTCDFGSEGCDPNCTPSSCHPTQCGECNGGTSVRDLARLWHALVSDEPKFLGLVGTRGFELAQSGGAFYNSYRHSIFYYPGVDGEKNGGSGACPFDPGSTSASCQMSQATRAGHPLIAAVLQSFNTVGNSRLGVGTNDVTAMLRWGYDKVLEPKRRIDSGTQLTDVAQDHALACNEGICFTALRTTQSSFKMVAWGVDPSAPSLTKLTTSTGPSSGYVAVSAVDVDAGAASTVAALIDNGKLVVARWWLTGGPSSPGLPPNVHLTFLGDKKNGGAGTLARVRMASDALAVTALRRSDGTIKLASWKLGGGSSPTTQNAVKRLAEATSTSVPNIGATGELRLAVVADPGADGSFVALTGDVTVGAGVYLQAWRVNSNSGAITYLSNTYLGLGRNLAIAGHGVGKLGVTYTTGTAISGTPRVEVWDVTHGGVFTRTLGWTETTTADSTAIAPLGPAPAKAGIAAAATLQTSTNTYSSATCGANSAPNTQASQKSAVAFLTAAGGTSAKLAAWDSPIYYNEVFGSLGDYRLSDSETAWGSASSIRLAVMPQSDPLLNHYVTEQMRGDGTLLLIAWRVGTPTSP
jgi:D-alanyl-D-alanine carboxypeptidase